MALGGARSEDTRRLSARRRSAPKCGFPCAFWGQTRERATELAVGFEALLRNCVDQVYCRPSRGAIGVAFGTELCVRDIGVVTPADACVGISYLFVLLES